MQDWLPEDHLARFVVEVVDQLDLLMLVVSAHMTQATNDKQKVVPALAKLCALPEAPVNNPIRAGAVRAAKANGGAGVWHYQTGDGLEAVLAERPGQGHRRVDIGDLGVEREADECAETDGVRRISGV
jgi:hypothetical protein